MKWGWKAVLCGLLLAGTARARSVEDRLFLVENGKTGVGSAFLMEVDGAVWMVSNCHVVQGNEPVLFKAMNNPSRRMTLPKQIEVAANRDAIRFPVDGAEGFVLGGDCAFDDVVFAFGNSDGAGVITKSKGKVVGKGDGRIEVTCEIIPGNSGGPVINERDEVIGISTFVIRARSDRYASDSQRFLDDLSLRKGTRYENTRRFAVPIHDAEWQSVDLKTFQAASVRFSEAVDRSDRFYQTVFSVYLCRPVSEENADIMPRSWIRNHRDQLFQYGYYYSDEGRYILRDGRRDSFERALRRWSQDLSRSANRLAAELGREADRQPVLYFQNELQERAEDLLYLAEWLIENSAQFRR